MTGRCDRSRTTTTADRSRVLRGALSKVRMPRSQRITCWLPCAATYSAAASHSPMVLDRPVNLAELAQQCEVLHVARADLEDVARLCHPLHLIHRHHLGDHGKAGLASRRDQEVQPLPAESFE